MLTQERLKELVHYDPNTGVFTRLTSAQRAKVGTRMNRGNGYGYLYTVIEGKKYQLHRLAFLYMTGKFPTHFVDHKDRNASNNKWCNLREATISQNGANSPTKAKSGFRGVGLRRNKWRAYITVNNKQIHLGTFDTPEEAAHKYDEAAKLYFKEFATLNFSKD
jgi:hypothetical protein